jgi:S1-C subfamily serine protease
VSSIKNFREIMKQAGPGTEIKLDVQRANKLVSVKLKLAEQPKQKAAK